MAKFLMRAFFFLPAIGLTIGLCIVFFNTYDYMNASGKSKGTITKVADKYCYSVKYQDQNNEVWETNISCNSDAEYKVGEKVTVYYNPHNPKDHMVYVFSEFWADTIILSIFALIASGGAFAFWSQTRKV